ncbi:MAG: Ig-like domain-containing protein, partial [Actinomycetota bacterium]|nr:Ig-like domain-containing protein [Actinomycetota bacterium]
DADGDVSTANLEITITGTNDAPVAVADTNTTTENTPLPLNIAATGVLFNDTDPDVSDILSVSAVAGLNSNVGRTVAGSTGGIFTINADGSYSFYPGTNFDYLAVGESIDTQVSYTIDDGNGGTSSAILTITITGANDGPVVVAVTATAPEDGPAITITANYTDADSSDTHTFSIDTTGTLGSVTNHGDGTFGYNPNGQFESLAVGETATDTFSYTVTDNHGASATQTVTVTITGANDAPTVTAIVSGPISEDAAPYTLDLLADASASDVDDSDVLSVTDYSVSIDSGSLPAGALSLAADGKTLSVDPGAFNFLAVGESRILTVSYNVSDGTATTANTATITITGANDGPTLTVDKLTGSMTEGNGTATLTDSGTLSFADDDATDIVTVSSNYNNDINWSGGTLPNHLNATQIQALTDGFSIKVDQSGWEYSSRVDLDFLGAGETITFTFDVVATDDSGTANDTSVTQTVTIT